MRRFRWFSDGPIPPEHDLRRRGWALLDPGACAPGSCPQLVLDQAVASDIHGIQARAMTVLIGVEASDERAQWLALGFGEVLSARTALPELEQRALRLTSALEAVPRRRALGRLELDLLLRDALVEGRRLGLHPREFGLLWRLAQSPGQPVSPQVLLAEVWQVKFRPETNSLAVHICRLRAKLASVGLVGIVSTTPEGCYALVSSEPAAAPPRFARPIAAQPASDREKESR